MGNSVGNGNHKSSSGGNSYDNGNNNINHHHQQKHNNNDNTNDDNQYKINVINNNHIYTSGTKQNRGSSLNQHKTSSHHHLLVMNDNSSQTININSSKKSFCTYLNSFTILLVLLLTYLLICTYAIYSSYLQSLIIHLHFIKLPYTNDLTDLHSLDLANIARNIVIHTSDNITLHGYHIIYPHDDLYHYNSISNNNFNNNNNNNNQKGNNIIDNNNTERELFFNYSLAKASRTIVYFHGIAATRGIQKRVNTIKNLATHFHAHVITIDYRGFGDSEGYPTDEGIHLDAIAVIDYIMSVRNQSYERWTLAQECVNDSSVEDGNRSCSHRESNMSDAYVLVDEDDEIMDEFNNSSSSNNNNIEMINNNAINHQYIYLYGHSFGTAVSTRLALHLNNPTYNHHDKEISININSTDDVVNSPSTNNAYTHIYETHGSNSNNNNSNDSIDVNNRIIHGLILDAPFTTMPEAARVHPITSIIRLFPIIFNEL
jgi:pimeloyl-ACP methyl ester carboxylesterase